MMILAPERPRLLRPNKGLIVPKHVATQPSNLFAAKNAFQTPWYNPTLDTAGIANNSSSSPTTLSGTQIVRGNCVIALVNCFANQTATCKVGSTAMTSLGSASNDNNTSDGGMQMFYLLNSGLGQSIRGTQTVTATWATAPTYAGIFSMSFFNVHNVGAWTHSFGTAAGATHLTITTVPGNIVVGADTCYAFANPPLSAFLQTLENTGVVLGTYFQMLSGYSVATSTSVLTGATMQSGDWAVMAAILS